ncbi:MAG: fibronectin type III domain-containing protein [Spirochaetales bacterium]|nr:fibronectin type III domain-containing protein [Spirochaetales bacterium]
MGKKYVFFSLFLAITAFLFPFDKQIRLGKEQKWTSLISRQGVVLEKGRWGLWDIRLKDQENAEEKTTDLLLHFNSMNFSDVSGLYRLESGNPLISLKTKVLGKGSAAFSGSDNALTLYPSRQSLLGSESVLRDFTIQFWLYPVTLSDGEEILTFHSALFIKDDLRDQSIHCYIKSRTLVFDFVNFFMPGDKSAFSVSLKGLVPLIPRVWRHHLIRFDSGTGLLEYCVDGRPEDIRYATKSGKEETTVYPAMPGAEKVSTLVLGSRYTGMMDEFTISREFVRAPVLSKYSTEPGKAYSRVFDLVYTSTRVKKIDAVFTKPENSEIYFYYKVSDSLESHDAVNAPWIPFNPGQVFEHVTKGRYIQVLFELYPDGTGNLTPSLSDVVITYEEDLPPSPPADVGVEAGDETVTLYWKSVKEQDVKGYLVFYGERPGNYNGRGSLQGDSPIDVGMVTSFKLENLKNGRLYFFTVVAYDSSEPPHQSLFSREVSIRPSPIAE